MAVTPEPIRRGIMRAIRSPYEPIEVQAGTVDEVLCPSIQILALLFELWHARRDQLLRHETYDRVGGIRKAIATRADYVYGALHGDEQAQARRLLVGLVRPGDTGATDTTGVDGRDPSRMVDRG